MSISRITELLECKHYSDMVEGKIFKAYNVNAALGDSAYLYLNIEPKVDCQIMDCECSIGGIASAVGILNFTEYDGFTSTGAVIDPKNKNRDSDKTALSIVKDSSGSSLVNANILAREVFGGVVGAAAGIKHGWKLNKQKKYIFSMQNKSGGAAAASLEMNFIEG